MKKTILTGLLSLVAVGCFVGGLTACKSADGTSVIPLSSGFVRAQEEESMNVTSIVIGDVRVQLLSETLVRIENKGLNGFENRASYIVSNREDWDPVVHTTRVVKGCTEIVTASYVVHVPQGGTAEDVYITQNGDSLYNYVGRTDTNIYLPSPSDELKSWYFTDSPRVIPSEYGYSVSDSDDPLQGWDFSGRDTTDIFVFLPKGDYTQFCNDYVSLTGKSEMVNLQTLGYWDSRWYAYSAETALQQIRDYRDRGYSIDVIVIDVDWKDSDSLNGGGIGYEINTDLFPNMAEFLEECKKLGVEVNFNDHPMPYPGTSNGLDKEEVEFRNENLKLILGMGLDYWWYDRNWHTALNSFDPDVSVFAFGMYAFQWITQDYFNELAANDELTEFARRGLIMGNVDGCLHGHWNYASDISAHRYTIQWTGDIGAGSEALAQEIYAAIFGGAEVGIPYMSSDIGGHTQAVTDEMYSRWMQYGALSSILRVHCTNAAYIGQEGRMPWLFGDTAEEVAKEYVAMRYHLLPLYYAMAFENYDQGLPLMRRLDINYSQYVESQRNDEYLLGDYILVAPIATATDYKIAGAERFTHDAGNNTTLDGLKAEYYNNTNFSGTPYERVDSNINFDWGTGGPGVGGLGNDNFSIRWTGNVVIGDLPASLVFFADDSVVVRINGEKVIDSHTPEGNTYDNYFMTPQYPAGSKLSIEVEYVEEGGNAHIFCYYKEATAMGSSASYDTRDVFIPEGTWIDVWSGERFVGPNTYTVTHPLETSPIFVREGALITLAEQGINALDKDWSNVALDVYPSKNFTAQATLYEDDTTTVAYKSGNYRTTDIGMRFDNAHNTLLVTINAANGAFSGPRAFTERTWNIRLHENPGWGDILSVRVNGKAYSLTGLAKSSDASPFAFEGAACDGKLNTFSFTGDVYEQYVIEIVYASATDSAVNRNYDATALNFTLTTDASGSGVDLTEAGDIDWITFGHGATMEAVRKLNGPNLFGDPTTYDNNIWRTYDTFFSQTYSDGDVSDRGSNDGAFCSQKNFDLQIKTSGRDSYYVLYVGGSQCTAKLTVRDRAGNVRTEFFGDFTGSFTRRIVIHCTSEEESILYISYAMVASENNGTASPSQLYLMGGYVSSVLPETTVIADPEVSAEVWGSTAAQGNIDLTDAFGNLGAETLDWAQFGEYGEGDTVRKLNGGAYIENASFRQVQYFGDYKAVLGWSDGDIIGAHTGSTNGICSPGGITVRIHVTPDVRYIRLYTGTWQSTNTTGLYTSSGKLLAQAPSFSAGDISACRIITFEVDVKEACDLIVLIVSTNAASNGNVSLPGVAVGGIPTQQDVKLTASVEKVEGDVDLTARGTVDWLYLGGNGAKKADATALPAASGVVKSGYTAGYEDFGAYLSFTDGTNGSASDLRGGVNLDWARLTIKVDKDTNYIEFYVRAEGGAYAGINVLTENGTVLYHGTPYTSGSAGYACIRLAVNATAETELTVVYYKGGNGGGSAGISAIAVG